MPYNDIMMSGVASNSSSTGTVTLSLATTTGIYRRITWLAAGGGATGTVTLNENASVIFKSIIFANSGQCYPFPAPIRTMCSNTASVVFAGGNPSYINVGIAYT